MALRLLLNYTQIVLNIGILQDYVTAIVVHKATTSNSAMFHDYIERNTDIRGFENKMFNFLN